MTFHFISAVPSLPFEKILSFAHPFRCLFILASLLSSIPQFPFFCLSACSKYPSYSHILPFGRGNRIKLWMQLTCTAAVHDQRPYRVFLPS